jgi:hypothetical protein
MSVLAEEDLGPVVKMYSRAEVEAFESQCAELKEWGFRHVSLIADRRWSERDGRLLMRRDAPRDGAVELIAVFHPGHAEAWRVRAAASSFACAGEPLRGTLEWVMGQVARRRWPELDGAG